MDSALRVSLQVRSAYRRRGWGFTDPQQISQCAKEGFVEKLKAQEGEGCHMWGTLAVNKVSLASQCGPIPDMTQDLHTHAHKTTPIWKAFYMQQAQDGAACCVNC